MKSSAAFASGLWVGALAVALAGGIYFYSARDRGSVTGGDGSGHVRDVTDKLRASEADCSRLGAEITQLKRTIEEQRRQMTKSSPVASPPLEPQPPSPPPSLPTPNDTVTDEPADLPVDHMTAVDEETGITVTLDPTGLALSATDDTGKRIWVVELESPARSLGVVKGQVQLTFSAIVPMDLSTGKRLQLSAP